MTSHGVDRSESEAGLRAANEALVRDVMELISSARYGEMVERCHDDLVFELPYGPVGMPSSFDKPTFAAMQEATFKLFDGFRIEPLEFHRMVDPDELVVEYASHATVAATGAEYQNRYIGVFRFSDGRIVAWREFHNPEVVARAFAG